ncbi:MAG: hypothetical protein LBC83_02650 [Oscillospiraceae bacterium]|nr:hypothetical protein [Oscillospiraceae bacterium]
MRKRFLAIALLCPLLLLGGCGNAGKGFIRPLDVLLCPPYANEQLEQLERKLAELQDRQASLGAQLRFHHARSGDYRDAVTMLDLNGDEKEEAISFYTSTPLPQTEKRATLAVFVKKTNGDESWKPFEIAGDGVTILSLAFPRLQTGQRGILVNWENENNERSFGLYHFTGDALRALAVQRCSMLRVCDFDGDGTDEIAYMHFTGAETVPTATILRYDAALNQALLLESTVGQAYLSPLRTFLGATPLPLNNSGNALLVDALRENAQGEPDVTTFLLSLERVEPKAPETQYTFAPHVDMLQGIGRFVPLPVRDINNDGLPELPAAYIPPGWQTRLLRWHSVRRSGPTKWVPEAFGDAALFLDGVRWIALPEDLVQGLVIQETQTEQARELRFMQRKEDGTAGEELLRMKITVPDGAVVIEALTEAGQAAGITPDFINAIHSEENLYILPGKN